MRSPSPLFLLLLAATAATLALAALPQGTAPPSAPAQYGLKNPWPGRYSPVAASHFTALPFVLGNSQGFFRCDPNVRVGRPKTLAEITGLIAAFPKVKAVGVGHSWWQEQFCAGVNDNAIDVVLTEIPSVLYMYSQKPGQYLVPPEAPPLGYAKTDLPWSIDEAAQTVTVLGGVGVRTLLDWLNQCTHGTSPNGWTLQAFPWYTDQTIAGAVATATHGSSLKYGSLSQQVTAIQIALADGTLRTFTAADGYLFNAAVTSVGRLGIVTQITLKITPSVPVRRTTAKVTYDSMVADVTAVQNAYIAAMAASGNNPNDPAVVAALSPLDETEYFPMLPIAAAWKVTYERLPADADIKTVTEVTSIRAKWRAAASTLAWTLERAYKKAGKPVPAWVTEKKNATAPAWLLPEFNGTVPDGVPNIDLPKDQAIQQTIASNNGLFAPKQAAEIAATEVYINAVTNDAPPAGSYRQYIKAVAVPPNPLYNVDPGNVTFSTILGAAVGINVVTGVFSARAAYAAQLAPISNIYNAINAYDQYEAAVPISRAGTCLAKLGTILYGPQGASKGFRAPGLVRFTSADNALLSPSNAAGAGPGNTAGRLYPSEPVMYFNMEDHISYDSKKPNEDFLAVFSALVFDPACGGRLHWGKAGWPTLFGDCYAGGAATPQTYPATWCQFGCAVAALDPTNKFASTWNGWSWAATNGGASVPFASCCTASGWNPACTCSAAPPPSCTAPGK